MDKGEWKKAWCNAYCIVCNPCLDGKTTSAHPMCLTTTTYILDPEILRVGGFPLLGFPKFSITDCDCKRVGLESWIPRADGQPEGHATRDHPPAHDANLASGPRHDDSDTETIGNSSSGSDESSESDQSGPGERYEQHEAQNSEVQKSSAVSSSDPRKVEENSHGNHPRYTGNTSEDSEQSTVSITYLYIKSNGSSHGRSE
ncbi:hypothetical protein QBC36DRAFT_325501 [Triangularia setosa]|uniref:Uncharacterized protein n=1 Tax=Triangularia setosa TaxID=2587417 RepID=A0AAN6WAS8_9PEZI|nr:hypothetical protein QBC36DRAFT_325501 [Podospora setosa]